MSTAALIPPCYDDAGNTVGCTDSTCFQDSIGNSCAEGSVLSQYSASAVPGAAQTNAPAVGAASANAGNGALSLTTPSTGGSGNGLANAALISSLGGLATSVSTAVQGPPKTAISLGASGLSVSGIGSIFSNPLTLLAIGLLAFLALRKKE